MVSIGMIRPVDKMGRIVIPMEIRRQLKIESNVDSLEIYMDGENIILRKYQPACVFCDRLSNVVEYEGRMVCTSCIEKMNQLKIQAESEEQL